MDEQHNTELQEVQTSAPEQPEASEEKKKAPELDTRRMLIRAVCGGYLIYLAYNLISSLLEAGAELVWSTIQIVSVIGAVVFVVVGVLLLVDCVKKFLASSRSK